MLLTKMRAYHNAVRVARKHFVDWEALVFYAWLGRNGTFRARKGGTVSYNAKKLLRKLVRMEYVWQLWGDVLPQLRFETDSIIIPNYFGRDFRIPLIVEGVVPPSMFLRFYPFTVSGDIVLDIGAYLGDTPLMWLHRGATSVIAVEPVPLHFQYLEKNVAGLPVTCLNVSIGVRLPHIPALEGWIGYGLWDEFDSDFNMLDVPVVTLTELVERYKPTVVKLNCEGCEHYVLEQLSELPSHGVKKLAVQFHEVRGYNPYESLTILENKLGKAVKVHESLIHGFSGEEGKVSMLIGFFNLEYI